VVLIFNYDSCSTFDRYAALISSAFFLRTAIDSVKYKGKSVKRENPKVQLAAASRTLDILFSN